jgi:hypothetical protein
VSDSLVHCDDVLETCCVLTKPLGLDLTLEHEEAQKRIFFVDEFDQDDLKAYLDALSGLIFLCWVKRNFVPLERRMEIFVVRAVVGAIAC